MADFWAEKHRPRSLAQVAGNPGPLADLRRWADAWEAGTPRHRAVLLVGPPGCGKTTAALALAQDKGWGVIELNASDARSGPAIQRVAGEGSRHETFSVTGEFQSSKRGQRKLIVIDEADNLYERPGEAALADGEDLSDRGGKRAIVETIVGTRQPIVLIVNDAYAFTKGLGDRVAKVLLKVTFRRVPAPTVKNVIQRVADAEGVRVAPEALEALAARAEGDVRSAVNDLQAAAAGRTAIESVGDLFGERNRLETVYDVLGTIFRAREAREAVRAAQDLDETPDFLLLWLDENLPVAFRSPRDARAGYAWLSRADVYLGRTRRRQNYALWGYATELMAGGLAVARPAGGIVIPSFQFPLWLRRMSASKGERGVRDTLGGKMGAYFHVGTGAANREFVPVLRTLLRQDRELAENLCHVWDLEPDEILHLLAEAGGDAAYAASVAEAVEARRAAGRGPPKPTEPAPEPAKPRETTGRSRSLADF